MPNETTCRHYNSSTLHELCEAGIRYNDVTPDWHKPGRLYRQPCTMSETTEQRGTCSCYSAYTAEELAVMEAESQQAIRTLLKYGIPLDANIKETCNGKDITSSMICPQYGSTLHFSHVASNSHASVWCEREGCMRWRE